ncbi:MAG TPA: N-methyl-L-tryptophan oxidase [Blastocatellia bacterium]|nr:N-methyl-L-tryptophan oxidase [Blastocatellia bacterium]
MQRFDIAIIGGGIMGAATACEAARSGARVALIDQGSMPNPRAASTDHSKVFRFAYPDPLYAGMALDALELWRQLQEETGALMMTRTGLLLLGQTRPSIETRTHEVLRALGVEALLMGKDEVAERYPQFDPGSFSYAVFDPSGAILHAESCVRALVELARGRGVHIFENKEAAGIEKKARAGGLEITCLDGEPVACARLLVASGPWTRMLLPELSGVLATTRQETVYFEPPESAALLRSSTAEGREARAQKETDFDIDRFPIFISFDTGFYGFPAHHEGAVKIANHNKGATSGPESLDEPVGEGAIRSCREFFSRHIPALARARVREARVCLYNNTPDDDFIIDWHPEMEGVLIATGFSGHGFKFGPVIGRTCAELLLSGRTPYELERFSLKRFG